MHNLFFQILNEAGLSTLSQEVEEHFINVVLKTASKCQSWSSSGLAGPSSYTCNEFGIRLHEIIQDLPPNEVPLLLIPIPFYG